MTAPVESDDYAAGYAAGVCDAAAWTAKRAAEIPGAKARQLRQDAERRWSQDYDPRGWPDVRIPEARAQCDRSGEGA